MPPEEPERLRAAEVIAAVCLASDLGMGFPFEHGFRATLMASRLCDVLDVDSETEHQAYYVCMLTYVGCTTDAAAALRIFGGHQTDNIIPVLFGGYLERAPHIVRALPPPELGKVGQVIEVARRLPRAIISNKDHQTALCEVAEMLASRLGLPPEVNSLFALLTERWDGKGYLRRAGGEQIPLALRIALVCRDAAFQQHIGGGDHAREMIRERAGRAFDPEVAHGFVANADDVMAAADVEASMWQTVLDVEPNPPIVLEGQAIDRALAAIGDFADLISPSLSGHSRGLADLAAKSAPLVGMDNDGTRQVRRAAYVHDVGRVAIDPKVWEKQTPLSRDEYEQVRLHPYHTERILSRSEHFQPILDIARNHHEHLDGTGYHRGIDGAGLTEPARLLAAADVFKAMTEPRPHRPALGPEEAARKLADLADDGCLDHKMVKAVIEAAGAPVPAMERPAGLTDREAEVIGLLARGLQTKQIGTALSISPKTADTHIQRAYRKMGVSTRAAATLFAMEHGLVSPG